ncbi:unnamed protein product [Meloidogyne enterolobii]|uniref:Uncharacterized protein n=1 Tax=Meloidogyne enterolobii TaxID=390850 RepID=A0ACB0XZ46_MELEN
MCKRDVFSAESLSEFSSAYFSSFLINSCRLISKSLVFLENEYALRSSANNFIFTSFVSQKLGRSDMYIRKNNGPSIDPCGTPLFISIKSVL